MSHYCVYVFHDEGTSVDDILAPYDENFELEEPVLMFTREEAIRNCRADIELYKNTLYSEFLKDPEKYKETYGHNERHIKYLEEEFPKKLNWTDEECHRYAAEGCETDEEGNIFTDCNPNAKWDWYVVGGRWSGTIPNDEVVMKDIDADNVEIPFAFITPEGEWVERGQMGWWGTVSNEMSKEEWDVKFREYLKTLDKNIVLTQVDCHT